MEVVHASNDTPGPVGLVIKASQAGRLAFFLAAAAVIGAWGLWQMHHHARENRYAEAAADPADLLELSLREDPPLAQYYLGIADVLSNEVFPANHAGARVAAERALALDPFSSRAWMVLAREHLFLGNDAQARAALQRSDEIDPRWPLQRLEAVRLWILLGDEQKGLDTAVRLAALSPELRRDAAHELISSGYSPRDVFNRLDIHDSTPDDIAGVIEAIRTPSLRQMEEVYSLIPEHAYRDAAFRRRLYHVAVNPLSTSQLLTLWKWHSPHLEDLGDERCIDNPQLRHPPFGVEFPLGWQLPAANAAVTATWQAAPPDNNASGRIRVEVPAFGRTDFRYRYYRFLLPPHQRITVISPVRLDPPGEGQALLRAVVGNQEFESTILRGRDIAGWHELSVDLPAFERPQIVEVQLGWNRVARGGDQQDARVYIGGIALRPRTLDLQPIGFAEEEP